MLYKIKQLLFAHNAITASLCTMLSYKDFFWQFWLARFLALHHAANCICCKWRGFGFLRDPKTCGFLRFCCTFLNASTK